MNPPTTSKGNWREIAHQSARYTAIAKAVGICKSVLDIGCGAGLLRNYLGACQYTGVDICQEAIDSGLLDGTGELICADVREWSTLRNFDALVFNESLYYLPSSALRRYARNVKDRGSIVISIWRNPKRFAWFRPQARALRHATAFLTANCGHVKAEVVREDGQVFDVLHGSAKSPWAPFTLNRRAARATATTFS